MVIIVNIKRLFKIAPTNIFEIAPAQIGEIVGQKSKLI